MKSFRSRILSLLMDDGRVVRWLVCCTFFVMSAGCEQPISVSIEYANRLFYEQRVVEACEVLNGVERRLMKATKRDGVASVQHLRVLKQLGLWNGRFLKQYGEAVRYNQRIVFLAPTSQEGILARVRLFDILRYELREREHAIEQLQVIVERFPKSEHWCWALGEWASLLYEEQLFTKVRDVVSKLDDLDEDARCENGLQLLLLVASSYGLEGHVQDAIDIYRKVLSENEDPALAALVRVELSSAFEVSGSDSKALKMLFEALRHHPYPELVQGKLHRLRDRMRHQHGVDQLRRLESRFAHQVER